MIRTNHHRKVLRGLEDSLELVLQSGKEKRDGSEFEGSDLILKFSRLQACPSQNFRNTPFSISHTFSPARRMDSLLRWSVENSTPRGADEPPPARQDIDPGVIDYILGKSDAVLMKEALEVALDENRDEEARIRALDDFEMLVEQIDNANSAHMCYLVLSLGLEIYRYSSLDLEKLKMWDPLQSLLTSQNSSDDIKVQTLWIIGTAVQNNPAAQISVGVSSENSWAGPDPH